jgi:nitroimidazol reductase NimA-like FMN-containing flavoprotein (pyridoxamine 5'-phosphate oxidase superfamily)
MSAALQTVTDLIEASRYLVLATADAAGRPWSSPVYFAHIGLTEFFWVSSPDVTHSRNIAVRPEVGIVVFDSQAAIGTGPGAGLRLYQATVDSHWILAKDGTPDHRIPVPLT